MASEARRIPDSEWEKHRAEIIRLYYDENQSQKAVSKYMCEAHDFVASKWQYERQFEKWKVKKNHSPATWNKLRGSSSTSSPITYHGRVIAVKKAKKAMARYKGSATSDGVCGALSPGFSSTATTTNTPTNAMEIRTHISMLFLTPSLLAWNIFNNQSVVQPLPPGYTNHFAQSLAALGNNSWELVTRDSRGSGLIQGLDSFFTIGQRTTTNIRATFPLSTLMSIKVPPETVSDGQMTSYTQSDAVMLHAIIHALSNDMIGRLGFDNLGQLWRFVKTRFSTEVPKILIQIIQSPYSGDLCRKIFQAVIEADDAACLRQIIRTWNINVDDMVCFGSNREQFSAVELAAGLMYPDVLGVLLNEGSDVNKAGAFRWDFLPRDSQHTLGAGIFHCLMQASEMRTIFRQESLISAPWLARAMNIMHQILTALHNSCVLQDIELCYSKERHLIAKTAWTIEDLAELHYHTKNTQLSWLCRKAILASIILKQTFPEYILDIAKACVPTNGLYQSVRRDISVVINKNELLDAVTRIHSDQAIRYLVSCGAVLSEPKLICQSFLCRCRDIFAGCLEDVLAKPPPQPIREPKSARLRRRLCRLISAGQSQRVVQTIEHKIKHNPLVFWNAMISETYRYSRRGGSEILLAALKQGDRQLVERLLDILPYRLCVDWLMLMTAWRQRHHDLHHLLLAAGGICIYQNDADVLPILEEVCLLESLVTHRHRIPITADNLRNVCLNGDTRSIERYIDLTQRPPLGDTQALKGIVLSTSQLDTLINYSPRTGWASSRRARDDSLLVAVSRNQTPLVRKVLQGGNIEIHHAHPHYYHDDEYGKQKDKGNELSLLGRLIIDYQTANNEAFEAVLDECCDSSRIDAPAEIYRGGETVLTPLLLAARHGHLRVVKLLVSKFEADSSLPAKHGRRRTPLQEAAEKGHFEIVEWLLERGADLNAPVNPKGGATALQLAAIGGYGGIMEILINRGADLNAPGAVIEGQTALKGAAEHGRLDAVKLLLDSGVVITGNEMRPFWQARQSARERGHTSVVKILDDYWELHTCEKVDHGVLLEDRALAHYYDDYGSSSGDDSRDEYSSDDET